VKSLEFFLVKCRLCQEVLSRVDSMIPEYSGHHQQIDQEPDVVGVLDLRDRCSSMGFKCIGLDSPVDLAKSIHDCPEEN